MRSKQTPFEVLGLAQDCTLAQATRQFRKLALKSHPDKAPADQKETATKKMALLNAAMDKVRETLEKTSTPRPSTSSPPRPSTSRGKSPKQNSTPTPEPKPNADTDNKRPRTESLDSFDSASSDMTKAKAMQTKHARLENKIQEMINIVKARTQSHTVAVSALKHLDKELDFAMIQLDLAILLSDLGDLDAVIASVKRLEAVIKGIRNRVKELERRANARRTMGGQYRPEEVEALNSTITSLMAGIYTGQTRETDAETGM
jgi:hypothetical protein